MTWAAPTCGGSVPFLLTRLLRGVTGKSLLVQGRAEFLLTRLLRGVTKVTEGLVDTTQISTHTPLARRDMRFSQEVQWADDFYSHASCEA